VAKTVTAMLVGIAIDEGHIRSADDLAAAYVRSASYCRCRRACASASSTPEPTTSLGSWRTRTSARRRRPKRGDGVQRACRRMFMFWDVRGQRIYVDPQSKLVMVSTAVHKRSVDLTALREADALWTALVSQLRS
jgi:CubicO group peptidase (beta-lactamase class C family)